MAKRKKQKSATSKDTKSGAFSDFEKQFFSDFEDEAPRTEVPVPAVTTAEEDAGETSPDITAELPAEAIRDVESTASRPPPVPANFASESIPESREPVAVETHEATISLGTDPGLRNSNIPYPVASVEEALEALSAEEDPEDLSEEYEDIDDLEEADAEVIEAVHVSPLNLVPSMDAAELPEADELSDEIPLDDMPAAPPPIPVQDLVNDSDLPSSTLDADLPDTSSVPSAANLPWSDEVGSGLPNASSLSVPQGEKEGRIDLKNAPAALANRLLSLGSPWLSLTPLSAMAFPSANDATLAGLTTSAQQLELEAQGTEDAQTKALIYGAAAQLWRICQKHDLAGAALKAAVEAKDDVPSIRRHLADLALNNGDTTEAANQLEALALSEAEVGAQVSALLELSILKLADGSDGDAAIGFLKEIVAGQPDHPIATEILSAWQRKSPGAVSDEAKGNQGSDGPEPKWFSILSLLSSDTDNSAVMQSLEALLVSDPGDLSALTLLWRLLSQKGEAEKLAEMAQGRAELCEGLEKARWLKLAALSLADSGDDPARIALLTQAQEADANDRVLEWQLESSLARSGQWQTLADRLSPDERPRSAPEVSLRHARRAAILSAHLGDDASALNSLDSALDIDSTYPWAKSMRLQLLRNKGDEGAFAETLLGEIADNALSPMEASARYFEVALIRERENGDAADIRAFVDQAQAASPHSVYRFTQWRLDCQGGDFESATENILSFAPFGGESAQLRAGSLRALDMEKREASKADVLAAYQEALEEGPDAIAALGFMGICYHTNDSTALRDKLPILSESLGDSMKEALLFEMARLNLHQEGGETKALESLASLAEGDTAFLPAVRILNSRNGEDKAVLSQDIRDLWPVAETQGSIAPLEDLAVEGPGSLAFQGKGYAHAYLGNLDKLATLLEPLSNGWACWHRGHLELKTGDIEKALDSLAVAWVQEPHEALAMQLLWGNGNVLASQWQALPRLPMALARFEGDLRHPAMELWLEKAGEIPADRTCALQMNLMRHHALGDGKAIAETCMSLAQGDQDNTYTWMAGHYYAQVNLKEEAAKAFQHCHNVTGLTEIVTRNLRLLAGDDAAEQTTRLASEMAQKEGVELHLIHQEKALWEESLGDAAGAIVSFNRALESASELPSPRLGLIRLHAKAGQWPEAADALKAQIEVTQSEPLKEVLLERLEEIQDTELEDPSARERRLRRRHPEAEALSETFVELSVLLESQERWADLAKLYSHENEKIEVADDRANLKLKSAHLHEDKLNDLNAARDLYLDVLDVRCPDPEAFEGLERIARTLEDWNGLVAVFAREAAQAESPRKLSLYRDIALTWQHKLNDSAVALASWQKVLELSPEDPEALSALVDLYRKEEAWASLVDVGSRLLRKRPEDAVLAKEVGEILVIRIGRNREAREYLEQAAALGQFSYIGFKALSTALEATGTRDERRGVYRLLAENAPDETEEKEAWQKLEELGFSEGDDELVLLSQEALVRLSPEDPAPLRRLALSYDQANRGDASLNCLDKLMASGEFVSSLPLPEQLVLHRRRAHFLEEAGRKEDALSAYQTLCQLDSQDVRSEGRILDLLQELSLWNRLSEHLEAMLERRGDLLDEKERVRRLLELGRAHRKAGHLDEGIQAYQQVVGLAQDEVAAYLGLIAIFQEKGDWQKLLPLYNKVITHATDPAQVVQAYVDKADVLDVNLSDSDPEYVDKSAMHFEKALQFDRRNTYCMLRLSEIAIRRGSFEKAGSWLQTLFSSGPSLGYQARAHVLSGLLAAEFQKDVGTAQSHFRRAGAVAQVDAVHIKDLVTEATKSPGNQAALFELYKKITQELKARRAGVR